MLEKGERNDILFTIAYFVEQIALILLYNFSKIDSVKSLWIGIFPVVFLSTIAIEKVFMKTDFREQKSDLENQLKEEREAKNKLKELKSMREIYHKSGYLG